MANFEIEIHAPYGVPEDELSSLSKEIFELVRNDACSIEISDFICLKVARNSAIRLEGNVLKIQIF